jgi:predicted NAD/FAD-dependent oxidoreductase
MTIRPVADRHRTHSRHFAVIGAGIAGVACARTLIQAGHRVTVFEREASAGGRMASESTPFGRFDSGAQYFTVRDPRFARVLQTTPQVCKPWSANLVRVLDAHGRVAEAALPALEPHWVAQPGMDALVAHWAAPLGDSLVTQTQVTHIERDALDPKLWQLRTAALTIRRMSIPVSTRCCWQCRRPARVPRWTTASIRRDQPEDRGGAHRSVLT